MLITKFAINAGTIKDVEIPELVGLTEEEVIQKLKNTKFTYEITGEDYSSEIEAGKIMTQDPAYRKTVKIKENSKIVLTLSKGTEKTTVPKVVGMSIEDAEKEIMTMGANQLMSFITSYFHDLTLKARLQPVILPPIEFDDM